MKIFKTGSILILDHGEMMVTVMMMVLRGRNVEERKGRMGGTKNSLILMMDYLLNNVERLFPKQQFHQVKGQILKELKSCELMSEYLRKDILYM